MKMPGIKGGNNFSRRRFSYSFQNCELGKMPLALYCSCLVCRSHGESLSSVKNKERAAKVSMFLRHSACVDFQYGKEVTLWCLCI